MGTHSDGTGSTRYSSATCHQQLIVGLDSQRALGIPLDLRMERTCGALSKKTPKLSPIGESFNNFPLLYVESLLLFIHNIPE